MEGEYTGHVKDGRVHGVGVCIYTDGSRYQGDWRAGLKDGRGTHSFASGDQFEGEWENGWMHGLGVYTWKIGDKYIGEVNFGRIHGFGTYTWRTNSKCGYKTPWPPHTPAHILCRSSSSRTALFAQVRRPVEGRQDAREWREDRPARCASCCANGQPCCSPVGANNHLVGSLSGAGARAGNLFEGEWREGKPLVKSGDKQAGAGPMEWLNEAVANVATTMGIDGNTRGEYSSVATHDEDEDEWRRPGR